MASFFLGGWDWESRHPLVQPGADHASGRTHPGVADGRERHSGRERVCGSLWKRLDRRRFIFIYLGDEGEDVGHLVVY